MPCGSCGKKRTSTANSRPKATSKSYTPSTSGANTAWKPAGAKVTMRFNPRSR